MKTPPALSPKRSRVVCAMLVIALMTAGLGLAVISSSSKERSRHLAHSPQTNAFSPSDKPKDAPAVSELKEALNAAEVSISQIKTDLKDISEAQFNHAAAIQRLSELMEKRLEHMSQEEITQANLADPSDPMIQASMRDAFLNQLDNQISAGRFDPAWQQEAESTLDELGLSVHGADIVGVDCSESLCRMETAYTAGAAREDFEDRLIRSAFAKGGLQIVNHPSDEGPAYSTIYVTRKGARTEEAN